MMKFNNSYIDDMHDYYFINRKLWVLHGVFQGLIIIVFFLHDSLRKEVFNYILKMIYVYGMIYFYHLMNIHYLYY